jgi:hypothetical protein
VLFCLNDDVAGDGTGRLLRFLFVRELVAVAAALGKPAAEAKRSFRRVSPTRFDPCMLRVVDGWSS